MGVAKRAEPIVVFDVGNVLLRWDVRFLYRKLFEDEAQMDLFLSTICTPAWNLEQDRGRTWAEGVALLVAQHPRLQVGRQPLRRQFVDIRIARIPLRHAPRQPADRRQHRQ